MNGGILLSFFNMRYFRDQLSTYCEFIPQMVFLNGLFGYLCILIVSKWISGSTADLYHVMIYMFLSPGTGGLACLDANGSYGCKENIMFPGQGPLQVRAQIPVFCPSTPAWRPGCASSASGSCKGCLEAKQLNVPARTSADPSHLHFLAILQSRY